MAGDRTETGNGGRQDSGRIWRMTGLIKDLEGDWRVTGLRPDLAEDKTKEA